MRNTYFSLLLLSASYAFGGTRVGIESPVIYDVQIASNGIACTQGINRAQALTSAPQGTKFQWTISNGAIVDGATAPVVEFVTNDDDAVGYAVLTVTMTYAGLPVTRQQALPIFNPPVITRQPQSIMVAPGTSATLSVEATDDAFVVDWFEGAPGDTSKVVAAGTMVFKTPALTRSTSYWARVSGSCGPVMSKAAVVTVAVKRRAGGK
jgi:hypothetical protein